MSIPEKPGDSVRTIPSPVQDVLSQVEETLGEPDPAKRARRLSRLRDVLKDAASRAQRYLDDAEREKEALVFRDSKLRMDAEMNADIREQLIRRGVATAEQLDELGLHTLDRYNELAEAGELEEALGGLVNRLGGNALYTFERPEGGDMDTEIEMEDGTILQIEAVEGFETSPEVEQFLKEQPEPEVKSEPSRASRSTHRLSSLKSTPRKR